MSWVEVRDFLPDVLSHAIGCPIPVALRNLCRSAGEFCERTRLWRTLDTFQVSRGCDAVCVPEGAELVSIASASLEGESLQPISLSELDNTWPKWATASGQGQFITQVFPNTVRVVPACEGSLSLRLVLKPAAHAEALPAFLYQQYRQCIVDGTLAEILSLPNQAFTHFELAGMYQGRFYARLDELFAQSVRGQQGAALRTRPSYF